MDGQKREQSEPPPHSTTPPNPTPTPSTSLAWVEKGGNVVINDPEKDMPWLYPINMMN